ncbi:MAG: histidine phosphatase family protein [Hydrogeniiclostridium sp.]
MFYLIRHGRTDYRERNTKIYQGFGVNLSPLSQEGIRQIQKTVQEFKL